VDLSGFAVNSATLKSVAAILAGLRSKIFKNRLPCDDWERAFRTRHRDITYRNAERKELAKHKGEDISHVMTLKNSINAALRENGGIFSRPEYIWNMDQTEVSGNLAEVRRYLDLLILLMVDLGLSTATGEENT